MARTIVIREGIKDKLFGYIMESSFCPEREKVLYIVKVLNANFIKDFGFTINNNDKAEDTHTVCRIIHGQPCEPLDFEELRTYLKDDAVIRGMFKDGNDLDEFLKRVIIEWYNGTIDKNGMMTVNRIER